MSMRGLSGPGHLAGSIQRKKELANTRLQRGSFRRILGYARPYSGALSVFLVTVVLGAVITAAVPVLAGRAIEAISTRNSSLLYISAGLIAALALLDAGLGVTGRWLSVRIGEGIVLDLRNQAFSHIQSLPHGFFVHTRSGALVNRLNSDVLGAQRAFTTALSGSVSNISSALIITATMAVISWQVTLIALALLPIFLVPANRVGHRLAAATSENMDLKSRMSAITAERFTSAGASLVKFFNLQRSDSTQFARLTKDVFRSEVRIGLLSRAFLVAMTLVATLAQALTYGFGGWLALANEMSTGDLIAIALLLTRLYGPLSSIANVRVDMLSAMVSFDRMFELLDLKVDVKDPATPQLLGSGPITVEFRNVSYRYPVAGESTLKSLVGEHPDEPDSGSVLTSVSFHIGKGEKVALVGGSGGGKSTLAMLLPRVFDPIDGAVLVDNVDIRDVSLAQLREKIGIVTQETFLFHETLAANLRLAKENSTDDELWHALEMAQASSFVKSLPNKLETVVGERGYRFSGGEKQRLAIARIILRSPELIVLDEATAHLDAESERLVQGALEEMLSGRSALIIAHRLSTIRDADKIVVLQRGRVEAVGSHEELMASESTYRSLYRTYMSKRD